jgi:succinate dehydrogenase/fumarate reductase flavoprotein subunit
MLSEQRSALTPYPGFMGGNSTKATSGINGALTRTQVDLKIGDSVKQFYDDTVKSARDKARPELIKVLTYKSAAAVEWLIDEFNLDLTLVSRLGYAPPVFSSISNMR